ncbi:MAG: lipopolysaccharide biosynthesis protein [Saprospiraceae bacterium]|nr:lipopolysaccharide biosynthesis protein [Saprospiraceae bacterium]
MSKSLSERSLSAILWVLLDKLGASVINFVVTIILARLLLPEDFGLVAMVMVFFELSSVFVESGFSTALIREKTISELDKSTTFIFSLIAALVVYAILFAGAPAVSVFFKQPLLTDILRIMGLSLIIGAFSTVQNSVLIQEINFKALTQIRFVAIVVSGGAAVWLAYQGWGVWALVVRFVLNDLMNTLLLGFIARWVPSGRFSRASFRKLFGFGSKILAAAILDKFYTQVHKLLIGKFFSAAYLGFYTQAGNFSNMVINTLFRTVNTVTYPVLAKLQDDPEQLKAGYRKILKLTSFVIVPVLIVLAVLAEPVLLLLVGEKWLPAAPMLQWLCISGLTYHFSTVNLNMLLVLGRSDLSLLLEVVKKVNITIAILIGLQFGIYGLIIGEVVSSYINLTVNAYYSNKLLRYSLGQQVRDILPTLLFSLAVAGVVFLMKNLPAMSGMLYLAVAAVVSSLGYLFLHFIARTEEMDLLRRMIIPKTLKLISRKQMA